MDHVFDPGGYEPPDPPGPTGPFIGLMLMLISFGAVAWGIYALVEWARS